MNLSSPQVLKVGADSDPRRVAGALTAVLRQAKEAELQAIGPHAVNQAVKAVAISRSFLALNGFDATCTPVFTETMYQERERTVIRLIVKRQESFAAV